MNDSILVGQKTLLKDYPKLNCRIEGLGEHSPKIFFINRNLNFTKKHFLLYPRSTVVFHSSEDSKKISKYKKFFFLEKIESNSGNFSPEEILKRIYKHKCRRLLIEGGSKTVNIFVKNKYVNKFFFIQSEINSKTKDPHTVNMVHLNDVKALVENRIGREGKGWTYAKSLLSYERLGFAGIPESLSSIKNLKSYARQVKCEQDSLMDDPIFCSRLGEIEIDLLALEYTELRCLASESSSDTQSRAASILKLKGSEIKQAIQKLAIGAGGTFSPVWNSSEEGESFTRQAMTNYLYGRGITIYGGCNEVQKDIIAKAVLGIKSKP